MSSIVRIHLSMVVSVVALAGTILGAVWAVAARDSDLRNLSSEMSVVKQAQQSDHEVISDIRGDIKAIRMALERLHTIK